MRSFCLFMLCWNVYTNAQLLRSLCILTIKMFTLVLITASASSEILVALTARWVIGCPGHLSMNLCWRWNIYVAPPHTILYVSPPHTTLHVWPLHSALHVYLPHSASWCVISPPPPPPSLQYFCFTTSHHTSCFTTSHSTPHFIIS